LQPPAIKTAVGKPPLLVVSRAAYRDFWLLDELNGLLD
jgi:hypothetical protein